MEINDTISQTQVTINSYGDSLNEIYVKKFTIIIPAYNEEKRIKPVIDEICTYISSNNIPWNIVVSIDGNDGTENLISSMSNEYHFLNYTKGVDREGKGAAIKRALNIASGEFLILMDADGAITFGDMVRNLPYLYQYDMINFNRYKNSENKIPKLRRYVSRGYNWYIRLLLGVDVEDTQCGYKIMRMESARRIFHKLTITNGFFYSPLFVYLKKMNMKTIEVSVRYIHSDGSKFNIASMILGGFISAITFKLRNSFLWKYVPKWAVDLYYRKFKWI